MISRIFRSVFFTTILVLILGLGTGTFATQCEYYFGISDIDGVEIDGKIIEQGTHEELLAKGGFYHTLYNSQFQRV